MWWCHFHETSAHCVWASGGEEPQKTKDWQPYVFMSLSNRTVTDLCLSPREAASRQDGPRVNYKAASKCSRTILVLCHYRTHKVFPSFPKPSIYLYCKTEHGSQTVPNKSAVLVLTAFFCFHFLSSYLYYSMWNLLLLVIKGTVYQGSIDVESMFRIP